MAQPRYSYCRNTSISKGIALFYTNGDDDINLNHLPSDVSALLQSVKAAPRLVAHLILVHDVAGQITAAMNETWPDVPFDRQAVCIGAATHDIGKVLYPEELSQPGRRHEEAGETLLLQHGFSEAQARFARTHGRWQEADQLEDLLVALADKIWKGAREEALELKVARSIAESADQEVWQIYMTLDDIISPIADDADERLMWQAKHPI